MLELGPHGFWIGISTKDVAVIVTRQRILTFPNCLP